MLLDRQYSGIGIMNRHVLEVLAGYLHRERFVPKALNIDELFVPIVTASE